MEASMETLKERRGTPQTGNGAARPLWGRSFGWLRSIGQIKTGHSVSLGNLSGAPGFSGNSGMPITVGLGPNGQYRCLMG